MFTFLKLFEPLRTWVRDTSHCSAKLYTFSMDLESPTGFVTKVARKYEIIDYDRVGDMLNL